MADTAFGSAVWMASVPLLRARAKATSIHSLKSAHADKFWSERFIASSVVIGMTCSHLPKFVPHCSFNAAKLPYPSFSQSRIAVREGAEKSKSQYADRSPI